MKSEVFKTILLPFPRGTTDERSTEPTGSILYTLHPRTGVDHWNNWREPRSGDPMLNDARKAPLGRGIECDKDKILNSGLSRDTKVELVIYHRLAEKSMYRICLHYPYGTFLEVCIAGEAERQKCHGWV